MNLTPEKLKQTRIAAGMTRAKYGAALGMKGNSNTVHKAIFELENGKREIWPKLQTAFESFLKSAPQGHFQEDADNEEPKL